MSIREVEKARLANCDWIQTFTGKQFRPLAPRPEDVCIEDIAHALSMKCRFTGHCNKFYSVAEHCVRASYIVPPSYQLAALLHDCGEAYLPDVAAPIKRDIFASSIGDPLRLPFVVVEYNVEAAIFDGLGLQDILTLSLSETVKRADLVMLATECRDLMGPAPADWGLTEKPLDAVIYPSCPEEAERQFLARFAELTR